MNINFLLVSHYHFTHPKKGGGGLVEEWMNEWKKFFISSLKSELFLNNTTNSRHLQPQDIHYSAFSQLIILNLMWTNSPRIFLWSIIQLSNGKKYYDKSLITYQKISKKIVIPSLSSMCFSGPISSEWLFSVNLVSALCMFLSVAAFFVWILCTAFFSIDFNKFLFKTGSHSTIHIFKNYFATVFLVFSFQFSAIRGI